MAASLLKALLALGPNLPKIWPDVLVIFAALQRIFAVLKPAEAGTLQLVELTAEEADLEGQVAALLAPGNALFDGVLLRQMIAFVAAHPELGQALIAWLLKRATGG